MECSFCLQVEEPINFWQGVGGGGGGISRGLKDGF